MPTRSGAARPALIARVMSAIAVAVVVVVFGAGALFVGGMMRDLAETTRAAPRFDPPVLAGQNVPGPCSSGGFYARDERSVVLIMAAHCGEAIPGGPLYGWDGQFVGTFGEPARLADCPEGRFCAPSDIITLAPAPETIPWGHLNLVDMGAGGYRTIAPEMRPLTCADIHAGDSVEVNGREHYRSGSVIAILRYEHETDTIFPCMVVTNVAGTHGDSGSAVLIHGQPAGTTSRLFAGYLAFTPLAEGLENLGLDLCTTPDCDFSPNRATSSAD
jgi:hypothetical protein